MQRKCLFWGERCHKGHQWVMKRSGHQDLRQEERLTLRSCANAVRFMIRAALTYEAANPQLWGKDEDQFPGFVCTRRRRGQERFLSFFFFFRFLFPQCFLRKYLESKELLFKVLLILDNAPGHLEPHEFNPKVPNRPISSQTQHL